MADVLKNFPFMSMEDYKWGYSSNLIKFMAYDATRVVYHSEEWAKRHKGKKNKISKFDDILNLPFLNTSKLE